MGSSESSQGARVQYSECLARDSLRYCERKAVRFTHKAIYAHALPGIAGIEMGQFLADILTVGLAEIRRATAGNAYHWFFVARDVKSLCFFVTYAHSTGFACSLHFNLADALDAGCLGAGDVDNVWKKEEWIETVKPRSAQEMRQLMMGTPSWGQCYKWDTNNCQHYAWYLYRPDYGPESCTV